MKTVYKVGVIGSGSISDIYISNMKNVFKNLDVVACSATTLEHAKMKADKYNIEARTVDEILEDKNIDVVVVLTPAPTHYKLIKKALEANKHVYTEKAMTVDVDQAKELLDLANEKNLYLGAAPDTFLGSAWQTALKAIQEGLIGDVTGFQIYANRDLDFLASLFKFLRMPGGGICFDYGVYYLTALTSLLGPIKKVFATVDNYAINRINCVPFSPEYKEPYQYNNESIVNAILETRSGIKGTFTLNGESVLDDKANFTIHGKKGILKLTDPNQFGGDVYFMPNDMQDSSPRKLESNFPFSENSRGVGVSEMVNAIQNQRPNRASKEMAYHVLEIVSKMMKSNESEKFEYIDSTFIPPKPFDNGKDHLQKERFSF